MTLDALRFHDTKLGLLLTDKVDVARFAKDGLLEYRTVPSIAVAASIACYKVVGE